MGPLVPFLIAFVMIYLTVGILLAEATKRASGRVGDEFSDGSYRMMVMAWPLVMYSVVKDP